MIRRLAAAMVIVLAFLILVAEVQRAEDVAVDQFHEQRASGAHQ